MTADVQDIAALLQQVDPSEMQVVHFIPGRLRVRSVQLRNDPGLADRVQHMLEDVRAVDRVKTNSVTGSVLVEYDVEQVDPSTIIEQARTFGVLPAGVDPEELKELARLSANGAEETSFADEVAILFRRINMGLKKKTAGSIDLRGLATLSFFSLGVRSLITSGASQMPWYNFFWFAFGTFIALEGPERLKETTASTGREGSKKAARASK